MTVKATDPSGSSTSATFSWKVANVAITPTANSDTASVNQGQSVIIDVRGNDTSAGGLKLSVIGVTAPASGSAVISAGGTTVTYTAPSSTFVGATTFFYTVTNGEATATAKVTVNVQRGNQAPVCTAAAASPGLLWPPNHKPAYVGISGITDADGGTPVVKFTSVFQDEPTNTRGDGSRTQDAGIEDNGATVWVRAERMGSENNNGYGRVYIVGFTATDSSGASCSGTVAVGVPHDQGKHNVPIPSVGRWDSISGALLFALAPNANDDSVAAKKNTVATVAVQSNDVMYAPVLLSIASAPATGTTTINANGTVTYTPPANWTGSTSFTYRLTGDTGSDSAVVSVTIKK